MLSLAHYFEFICFVTVCSHGGEKESKLSGVSYYKGTSPIMRAPLS